MKYLKNFFPSLTIILIGLSSVLFSVQANAECGKVVIASQNWASAELMAEVDKVILENGYGCEVELIPGSTMPTFTSMDEKGAPDMNPEQWKRKFFLRLEVLDIVNQDILLMKDIGFIMKKNGKI